jgi:hypothetical protein
MFTTIQGTDSYISGPRGREEEGLRGERDSRGLSQEREAETTLHPIFFPHISSTTHKKSQRSSKNKSGSDLSYFVKNKDHLNSNSTDKEDHGKENTNINHLPIN